MEPNREIGGSTLVPHNRGITGVDNMFQNKAMVKVKASIVDHIHLTAH